MSNSLENYVGQPVIILSCDGRCFSGTLKGKDLKFPGTSFTMILLQVSIS
jgi:hypothetical protein